MTITSAEPVQISATTQKFNKPLGFSTMFVSATLMGFVGFFARHIETTGDVIAFFRMCAGAIGCLVIILASRHWRSLRATRLSPALIFGGASLGLCLAAYVSSTKLTSLANAVFLIYTGPLISAILARIFLKERIKPIQALFLSFVFVGMILILGLINYVSGEGLTIGLEISGENFVGDMLALASGVGYGMFLFLSRYRTDVPSDVRAFWNFVWGAVGIGIVFIFKTPDMSQMTQSGWVWLISMAFLIGFGALGLLTVAGRHLKAVELSTVSYWECVVGAGVGFFVYGETMSLFQIIGGILITVGGMGEVFNSLVKGRQDPKSVNAMSQV